MFFFVPPVSPAAIVADLIELLIWIIIIEALVSNIVAFGKMSSRHPVATTLRAIVNPILNPVRRLLPPPSRTGNLDLSPLIVIVLLQVLRRFLGL